MSGPKVVRIVTRQEIEAICRRHLAAVEAAAEDLRRIARRVGSLDNGLEQSLEERRRRLTDLFAANRVLELQKQAPEEVLFLRAETLRLREQAAKAAASARTRQRHLTDAARSVAAALQAAGLEVSSVLDDAARGRADGAATIAVERELAAAARKLSAVGRGTANPEAAALAARLLEGARAQTVVEWLASQPVQPDPARERLDRLLAEISTLEAGGAPPFEQRALEIAADQDEAHRALLTDSLVLDLSAYVARLRAEEQARQKLGQVLAMLSQSTSKESGALRSRVKDSLERPSAESADRLEAEAAALTAAEAQAFAAAERRRAILSGLSELGYEVAAEMETAWIREGRIVVRRPGTSDYGVELGAPADSARMQIRLVGSDQPGLPRDAKRDADQETIWCGDFDRLKAAVTASGSELVLERALQPGVQPVKTVSLPGGAREEAVHSRRLMSRTRP